MKNKFLLILFYVFVLFLCLQKGIAQEQIPIYGEFKIKKLCKYYDANYQATHFFATASLYNDGVTFDQTTHLANLGSVEFNGIGLKYNSLIKMYHDTIQRKSINSINWTLANYHSESFSQSCSDSFPSIANIDILPNILKKSQTLEIILNNVSQTDAIEFNMFDGMVRTEMPYFRHSSGNANSISVSVGDLSVLAGNNVEMNLCFIKNEYKVINGKRYKFEKRFEIIKHIAIVE